MRVIIAGSRHYNDYDHFLKMIPLISKKVTSVVCGVAKGADTLGEYWGLQNQVPIDYFEADWTTHGNSAGYIRNAEMANNAEMLIAFWTGETKNSGTKHMIDLAHAKGLVVMVALIEPHHCKTIESHPNVNHFRFRNTVIFSDDLSNHPTVP